MFKRSNALFLYAETSVHLGSGESLGAIDLAIQRERYTGFPTGAAQGIKGAIRDWFEHAEKRGALGVDTGRVLAAFGPDTSNAGDHAGAVAFTDARLLLFPVRSMKGVFAWITCPFALGRLHRDLALGQQSGSLDWEVPAWPAPTGDSPQGSKVFGAASTHACKTDQDKVLLEEEVFTYGEDKGGKTKKIAKWLSDYAFPKPSPSQGATKDEYDFWRSRIADHLLLVSDDDFRHFVKTSTEVQARVALGEGKSTNPKKGGNLFYQENLPPESLLYSVVLAADDLSGKLPEGQSEAKNMLAFIETLSTHRLQIGGDETTGKGYVYAQFLRRKVEADSSGETEKSTQGSALASNTPRNTI